MKTQEYLEKIKARLNIKSDYALSKSLGVTRQTISRYQKGYGQFDDAIAIRAAKLLGINPGVVILDMHRDRAQSIELKNAWQEISNGFHPSLRNSAEKSAWQPTSWRQ